VTANISDARLLDQKRERLEQPGGSLRTAPKLRVPVCSSITTGGRVSRASCLGRDERGHEGAGPGLERLGYTLSKDRVQRGAEQPGARIGVRFPHV